MEENSERHLHPTPGQQVIQVPNNDECDEAAHTGRQMDGAERLDRGNKSIMDRV